MRTILAVSLLFLAAAIAAAPAVPTTDDGSKQGLLAALDDQIDYLNRLSADRLAIAGQPVSRAELLRTATLFRDGVARFYGTPAFADFVRDRFRAVPIPGGPDTAMATGYFSTELRASPARTDRYRYPIYGPPATPASPGPTRAEIEDGALAGTAPVIAWADDPLEVYWLHVQGSGTLFYPDGRRVGAQYAASNGRPYVSIGKILVNEGHLILDEATLGGIDRYLRARPAFARGLLRRNPRYIYFRLTDRQVLGAGDTPLTPMRSIAADRSIVPLGALVHVAFNRPLDGSTDPAANPHARALFLLVQDEGAAIKGPGRIDLYCGSGDDARALAGSLRRQTTLTVLLAK